MITTVAVVILFLARLAIPVAVILFIGETMAFRRHHFILVVRGETVDQLALIGITRDDGSETRLPFGEGGLAAVELQPPLSFFPVAAEAVRLEQRDDLGVLGF